MAIDIKLPRTPWTPKITKIIDMWLQPCDVNIFIWLTAYIAASPQIAYSILLPDCSDYVQDRFRMSARNRRRGSINVADHAKPITPQNSGINTWLFKMNNAAQRVGWYMTVIDAVLEWVIVGTSFAYQFTGCDDPDAGYASASMTNKLPLLLPATRSIIAQWEPQSNRHFFVDGASIVTPKGYAPSIGFTLQQNMGTGLPFPDCTWTAEIVDTRTGWRTGVLTPDEMPDGGRNLSWASRTTAYASESHRFVVLVDKSFGVFNVSGNFIASGEDLGGLAKSACGSNIQGGF